MLGLYTFNINSQANILVNDNGEICLSDFGLSVFAECRKKKYASLCGGPESWLSPLGIFSVFRARKSGIKW